VETLARLLQALGERLELSAACGPRGNSSVAELRADYERLTPEERVAQAAELSRTLLAIAASEA
jgi:hypothetical protein